jgi:hypothetical protein
MACLEEEEGPEASGARDLMIHLGRLFGSLASIIVVRWAVEESEGGGGDQG